MTGQQRAEFWETVWNWYGQRGRHDLPWRQAGPDGRHDAYAIMVSELMLQQTQVNRVIPKFVEFMDVFPTVDALAKQELGTVLRYWQGLGYNRRAQYLWRAARMVVAEYGGIVPHAVPELTRLPGIGPNTAGAIMAYAYNQPVAFIETNIRTVYIHHFFPRAVAVHDREILAAVVETLPPDESVRDWYWALMDYGTYLKQTVGNLNTQSRSYIKQSAFSGSRRQIRGAVLRRLAEGPANYTELQTFGDERMTGVLEDLVREGLVRRNGEQYLL